MTIEEHLGALLALLREMPSTDALKIADRFRERVATMEAERGRGREAVVGQVAQQAVTGRSGSSGR